MDQALNKLFGVSIFENGSVAESSGAAGIRAWQEILADGTVEELARVPTAMKI
jgi:hypothetical protein